MTAKKKKNGTPPRFRSVEEESAYWDKHSPLDLGDWTVIPYDQVCKDLGARKEAKVPVTFRLEKRLVRRLKEAARQYGIKYQTLAREILWRSLTRKAE